MVAKEEEKEAAEIDTPYRVKIQRILSATRWGMGSLSFSVTCIVTTQKRVKNGSFQLSAFWDFLFPLRWQFCIPADE